MSANGAHHRRIYRYGACARASPRTYGTCICLCDGGSNTIDRGPPWNKRHTTTTMQQTISSLVNFVAPVVVFSFFLGKRQPAAADELYYSVMAILEIGALVNLSILTCTIIDRSVRVQCMSIQINPVVYNYIYTLSSSIFLHLIDYPSFQTEQNTRCCLNNFGRHACSIYILNHTVGFSGSFIFHRIDCWHHMRSL